MVKDLLGILTGTLVFGVAFIYPTTDARAQITLDGSLGSGTLTGPNYEIPESVGEAVGNNLFHSFGKFNLNSNEAAIFQSAGNIRNILSRVTGGSASSIDGLIRTLGSDVNFFLINPSGIIFGENARLDITGSFVGSTANAIQFGDRGFFSATNLQPPSQLLTINPSALFFNQVQPGKIESKSNLQVPDSRSFLLVGGDINLDGVLLNAFGGQLELAGLAGDGTVGLNVDGNDHYLSVPDDVARADISLTNGAIIDVSAGGFGSITVNARNLEVRDGSQLVAGIRSGLGTPEAQAGDITINATDSVLLDRNASVINDVNSEGVGNGGSISVTTGFLEVTNGGFLRTSTFGKGNASDININATGKVIFDGEDNNGSPSGTFGIVESEAVGKVGDIFINTSSLEVTNGASVGAFTRGVGDTGSVTINATDSIAIDGESKDGFPSEIFSSVNSNGVGKVGGIFINTGSLEVTNGAVLDANTFGEGDAGSVTINATSKVRLDGESNDGFPSVISSAVFSEAVGTAGGVLITTDSLEVTNGAQLSASTFGKGDGGSVNINATSKVRLIGESKNGIANSGAFSQVNPGAVGNAGGVSITTNSLEVTNGAQVSVGTFAEGDAGTITINASDRVKFDGEGKDGFPSGAFSNVRTEAVGTAGGISINTNSLEVTNGAVLNANTASSGKAGDITLNVSENITLAGSETGVFASTSENSTGNGGNIVIDPKIMTIRDGAKIAVDSQGVGIGGDIELAAGFLTLDKGTISAETRSNTGGNILLNLQDLLLLRNGSQITSTAGNQEFGGDGGNISINTPFIVALPQENSDITANAFSGSGGGVDITANGIFGIFPQNSPTNNSDITASSESGINGEVNINELDIDPNRGLIELPTNLFDASQQVAQACTGRGRQQQSSFIATGRGGLPLSPNEPLRERAVITNWVDLPSQITERRINKLPTASATKSTPKIVEAQKIIVDKNGETFLVAESPQNHTPSTISCN
ncbi:MAG: filamentous hemagglutinin N-terminal domain-containing protein [Rivularia sp. (in: cyanobacteria)]